MNMITKQRCARCTLMRSSSSLEVASYAHACEPHPNTSDALAPAPVSALDDVALSAIGSTCLHLRSAAEEGGLWEALLRAGGMTHAGLTQLCQLSGAGVGTPPRANPVAHTYSSSEVSLEWELDESADDVMPGPVTPPVSGPTVPRGITASTAASPPPLKPPYLSARLPMTQTSMARVLYSRWFI